MYEFPNEYFVDREAIEEIIGSQFLANLQAEVDTGEMTQGEAVRIHTAFLQSPAFTKAVDACIKQLIADLTEREQSGPMVH